MFTIKCTLHKLYFQSLELISNGAFGKVYKVEKLNSSGDLYAMKILEKSSVTKLQFNYNLCGLMIGKPIFI